MNDGPPSVARHERVSTLFLEACDLPPQQREAFLNLKCGDDDDLRQEVLELLAHDAVEAAVDQPVVNLSGSPALGQLGPAGATHPARIGRYEILGVLGEGGMGTVYRARQENPDRIVALKVIRPGIASRGMIRRFELEARLLGRLQHPGIAQIHEAGTADSGQGAQPYFAMELIDGRPLLAYASAHDLNTRQRLELVARICDAVQHAHQKGIVHRDLKPGNILVPEEPAGGLKPLCPNPPTPRVLDFGVARVTDADIKATTLQTDIGQLIGTLPYMSPEQIAGDPHEVDVRSDVYALGVITYELLTGRLPFNVGDKTIVEAARVIQSETAARLSVLDRTLRGDVETIVIKAMEKDKTRRYQSASELAEDIRRYLRDEPIIARPPSAMYQFRKFARRNRALVAGTAVAIGLLIVAVVGTSYGLVVARQQRDEARRALTKAEAVRQFFLGLLATPAPGVAGRDVKVVDALQNAEAGVAAAFPDQPEVRGDVYEEMAVTLAGLGEFAQAERHAREALRIRTQTLGESHFDTISAMNNLANILMTPDGLQRAETRKEVASLLDRAIELCQTKHPDHPEYLLDPISNKASLAFSENRLDDAEAMAREGLELAKRSRGEKDAATIAWQQSLAMLLIQRGNAEGAVAELRTVVALQEEIAGARAPATLSARHALVQALRRVKRYDEAEAICRQNLSIVAEVMGPNHTETIAWHNDLGYTLSEHGRHQEAAEAYREGLQRAEAGLGPDDFMTIVIKDSYSLELVAQSQYLEAEPLLRDCMTGLAKLHGPEADSTLRATYRLIDALLRLGKIDEAVTLSADGLAKTRGAFDDNSPTMAVMRSGAARSLQAAGRTEEAQALIDACVRDCPQVTAADHFLTTESIAALAQCCDESGLVEQAKALRRKMPPTDG